MLRQSLYWIPIVLLAAVAQTARNAAQRSLVTTAGTWAATLARFVYGLPLAVLWLVLLHAVPGATGPVPSFDSEYFGWLLIGAIGQLAATAAMLVAMSQRNFVVGSAYAKTDALQVAIFATLFLREVPSTVVFCAVVIATAGVMLLSIKSGMSAGAWVNHAAGYGVASGAAFAISTVGYRGAAVQLHGNSPWLAGAWGVVLAQAIQSALLVAVLSVTNRRSLVLMMREWRSALLAGAAGATASIAWFTSLALTTATNVRALGMVEVVFSYAVSHRFLKEKITRAEKLGLTLVVVGVAVLCLRLG
jgi:drug/metabolite transporter (DMT)-like permease